MSAIKCDVCLSGDVLPADSLDPDSVWRCTRCGHSVSVDFVESLVDSIEEELDSIANNGDFDKYLEVSTYLIDIIGTKVGLKIF